MNARQVGKAVRATATENWPLAARKDRSTAMPRMTKTSMTHAIQALALLLLCFSSPAASALSIVSTNIFAPQSTPAKSILNLSMFVVAITGIIFVVVFILLVYSISKFRATAANAKSEPAQVYGSTQIELAWTITPVLIVVVLFLATARVIHAVQD